MGDVPNVDVKAIMDSLSDGVYVCDLDRRVTYWSKSAERITGWSAEDVVGRQCFDNVLCHIDKDGHELCGEEYCPLHRAIKTNAGSKGSLWEGDHLLLFSDGAVEVDNADGQMLGVDGLIAILKAQDYPTTNIQTSALEVELLKYSDGIRIEDDLTFIEIRFNHF